MRGPALPSGGRACLGLRPSDRRGQVWDAVLVSCDPATGRAWTWKSHWRPRRVPWSWEFSGWSELLFTDLLRKRLNLLGRVKFSRTTNFFFFFKCIYFRDRACAHKSVGSRERISSRLPAFSTFCYKGDLPRLDLGHQIFVSLFSVIISEFVWRFSF